MTKPTSRKSLTVKIVTTRRVYFRLGQKVLDRNRNVVGKVDGLVNDGCYLRRWPWNPATGAFEYERWFAEYADVRPHNDGYVYLETEA